MLIEPYVYVRSITLGLGTVWTVLGLLRLHRALRRWEARLVPLGVPPEALFKALVVFTLRSTILDPINLALLLLLIGIWTIRALV